MGKAYTQEERNEAMKLATEIGNRAAAERLGVNLDTLYTWQSKARVRETKRAEIIAAKSPEEYAIENERLKKELKEKEDEVTILQEALGFFVKRRKK
jgi:transposase-like protein